MAMNRRSTRSRNTRGAKKAKAKAEEPSQRHNVGTMPAVIAGVIMSYLIKPIEHTQLTVVLTYIPSIMAKVAPIIEASKETYHLFGDSFYVWGQFYLRLFEWVGCNDDEAIRRVRLGRNQPLFLSFLNDLAQYGSGTQAAFAFRRVGIVAGGSALNLYLKQRARDIRQHRPDALIPNFHEGKGDWDVFFRGANRDTQGLFVCVFHPVAPVRLSVFFSPLNVCASDPVAPVRLSLASLSCHDLAGDPRAVADHGVAAVPRVGQPHVFRAAGDHEGVLRADG